MNGLIKNFFAVISKGGKVVATKYMNALSSLPLLKDRYKDCEIDVHYIGHYGFTFGKTSGASSKQVPKVRRVRDGKIWNNIHECRHDLGVTYRTLAVAIRNHRELRGEIYEYIEE